MSRPSVRILFVSALALAVPSIDTSLHAQNPITAAREAFRKAQEEARRKAQEEKQRQTGQAPSPGQPAPGRTAAQPSAPQAGARAAGTPETTAALAKAASFVDVGGLKLGMPIAGVEAAIRALNPALKSQPPSIQVVWPYDRNDTTKAAPADAPKSVQAVTYQEQGPQGAREVVQLMFAVYPNPAVVTSIERQVHYEQGKGPAMDAVVQSLRMKYGAESAVLSDQKSSVLRLLRLRWLHESANQPLQGNLAVRMRACNSGASSPGDGTSCAALTVIDGAVDADGNGVVTHLSVQTGSYPLTQSATEATDAYLRQVDEERAKRQRDETAKRAVPKL